MLVDSTECKIVTGEDDHPRFCVISSVQVWSGLMILKRPCTNRPLLNSYARGC